MKHDYTAFDAALLDLIDSGCNTMTQLDSKANGLHELAKPFRVKDRFGNLKPTFRVIDGRLQALRKRGDICFTGKAWARMSRSATV